jgi:hypothetical protein
MSGEPIRLTEDQIDKIAEKAAKKALNSIYADVGRGVLRKLAWLAGLVVLGLAFWLAGKGSLPWSGK